LFQPNFFNCLGHAEQRRKVVEMLAEKGKERVHGWGKEGIEEYP
jgi:hypothetical protein